SLAIRNGRHVPTFIVVGIKRRQRLKSAQFDVRIGTHLRQYKLALLRQCHQVITYHEQAATSKTRLRPFHQSRAHIHTLELMQWIDDVQTEHPIKETVPGDRSGESGSGVIGSPE